jgi:hypothetical protein
VVFLHGLKQRRLRSRAGAVDFVGEQQLGEDWSTDETEPSRMIRSLVEDLRTKNV